MSANVQSSEFSVNDYVENAGEIRIAKQINDQNMHQLFEELAMKTQEYRNRWLASEAKVDSMKTVIAKQWHEINLLHRNLAEVSKKLRVAESTAQTNATKYNHMYQKLKGVILESAQDFAIDGESK